MFRKRWEVWMEDACGSQTHTMIDGPFRLRWLAEAAANTHRAHEAQRARVEGDAMHQIDVMEAP